MATELKIKCKAAADHGGRCKGDPMTGSDYCIHHQGSTPVTMPGVVLLKLKITKEWADTIAQAANLNWKERDENALDRAHRAHAEQFGRQPTATRRKPDSGTPVFGPKGLASVTIDGLLEEIEDTGYTGVEIYLYQKPEEPEMAFLVIVLVREPEGRPSVIYREFHNIYQELVRKAAFRYVHVWDNPPGEDDRRTATVNALGLMPGKGDKAAYRLDFDNGVWAAVA